MPRTKLNGVIGTWVRRQGGQLEAMQYTRGGATWFLRGGRLARMIEYTGLDLATVGGRVEAFGFVRGVSLRGLRELG